MSSNREMRGRDLRQPMGGGVGGDWGATGEKWAQKKPVDDPLSKGEIRWGAATNFSLDVGDGKSGVLIPQTTVPITVSPTRTLIQSPNAPARIWEVLLGIFWQNPNEGRQAPANGMVAHANFLVNYGVGTMNHTVVLEPGNGIDPTDDTVTQVEPMGVNMFVHTFDVSQAFNAGIQPPASEIGSTLFTSSAFTIETYVWAENLTGAPFGPPGTQVFLNLRAFCAIAPYNRGLRT
jgi:hypothetical protein